MHHMYVHRNSYTCMAGSVCASSMALMVAIAGGISNRVAKQQTVAQITGRRPCLCELVSGHSGIIARMAGEPGDEASTLLPFVAHTVYVLRQCKRLIYKIY